MDARDLLNKISENLSTRRVFGVPYEKNGVVVIPVALIAGGGGGGSGPFPDEGGTERDDAALSDEGTEDGEPERSSAAGGGFGGVVLPLGVYVVKGDDVKWVSALDTPLFVFAGLSALFLLLRRRGRRRRASNRGVTGPAPAR